MRQHRTHFRRRQHHGKARRSFRALKTVQPPQLLIQHFLIKEQNGAQGLILRRRRHIPLRRKVGQESVHLLHPHLRGVLLAVKKKKQNTTTNPNNTKNNKPKKKKNQKIQSTYAFSVRML